MQIVYLSDAPYEINKAIEMLDLQRLNHTLRSIFQCLFKFFRLGFKSRAQLFKLLRVAALDLGHFLRKHLVEEAFSPIAGICFCID